MSEAGSDRSEQLRDGSEVVERVAGGPVLRVAGGQRLAELAERVVVVESAGDVAVLHVVLVQDVLPSLGVAVARLGDRVPHLGREVLVAHEGARDADDNESTWKLPALRQRRERGIQLAVGEVTRRAEHDECRRDRYRLAAGTRHALLRSRLTKIRGGGRTTRARTRVIR